MLKYGNKELRNLEEQVCKNKSDIEFILEEEGTLNKFGIKVIGEIESADDLPTVEEYKEDHDDWAYGDAYAIGTESPYDLRVLTRANGTHPSDYWFNIGSFPMPGPTGPEGPQGPQGEQGLQGPTGPEALTFSESISIATIDIDVNVTLPLTNFNHTPIIGDTVLIPLREIATNLYALGIVEITAVGDTNATGVINEYMPLPKGEQGDQGEPGPKGDTGADVLVVKPILNMTSAVMGTTITLNNVLANFNRTPVVGDSALAVFYVPNATPVYTYIGKFDVTASGGASGQSTLTLKASQSIIGPQGQQGPQGPQGNPGPTGSQGPIALAYWPVVYNGNTEPSSVVRASFSSFNRHPSTLFDYYTKVLMYWLDTTTGKYYHAVYNITDINPGLESVSMSLFESVEINFGGGGGSSDYNALSNKPIVNVDITSEDFTPVEGTHYRNTNDAAYTATDFTIGESYSTLYFPTKLSKDQVEALLEPIIANQTLLSLSGFHASSLRLLLDDQNQKYLSWHSNSGDVNVWTKATGWNIVGIEALNSELSAEPLQVGGKNTYNLVSSAPISYIKKHIYLYEDSSFKDIDVDAVSSVNSKTGAVVLTASDINATNTQSVQANLERIDGEVESVIDSLAGKQAAITTLELNGATTNTVTYDSSEGINIVGTGEINGTDTISTEFNIPIIPGSGIIIDATSGDDAVEIKVDQDVLDAKQDALTAGANITITSNNVISATAGISIEVYTSVQELPAVGESNVFYLVATGAAVDNYYDEYIWLATDQVYEKIGSTEVDLSQYVKNTDYASSSTGGVIKVSNTYGFSINSANGILTTTAKTAEGYDSALDNCAISKGTLNNVIADRLATKSELNNYIAKNTQDVELGASTAANTFIDFHNSNDPAYPDYQSRVISGTAASSGVSTSSLPNMSDLGLVGKNIYLHSGNVNMLPDNNSGAAGTVTINSLPIFTTTAPVSSSNNNNALHIAMLNAAPDTYKRGWIYFIAGVGIEFVDQAGTHHMIATYNA